MCMGVEYYIPDNDGEDEQEKPVETKEINFEDIPF